MMSGFSTDQRSLISINDCSCIIIHHHPLHISVIAIAALSIAFLLDHRSLAFAAMEGSSAASGGEPTPQYDTDWLEDAMSTPPLRATPPPGDDTIAKLSRSGGGSAINDCIEVAGCMVARWSVRAGVMILQSMIAWSFRLRWVMSIGWHAIIDCNAMMFGIRLPYHHHHCHSQHRHLVKHHR